MKRRIVKGIVIGLAAAAFAGALAACGSDSSAQKPYDVLVTYNYNVSHLLDSVSCTTQYLGLPEGGYAMEPGFDKTNFRKGSLEHSYIEGWYLPKCNEEGAPLDVKGHLFRQDSKGNAIKADAEGYLLKEDGETYLVTNKGERLFLSERGMLFSEKKNTPYKMNSSGQVLSQDEKTEIKGEDGKNLFVTRVKVEIDRDAKWDFKTDRVTEDITLYANFIDTPRIIVLDEEGQEVAFYEGDPGTKARAPRLTNYPKKADHTFYGFYTDAGLQTPMVDADWTSYTYPTADEIKDDKFPTHTVYAKFIEGEWAIIREEAELAPAIVSSKDIWLDADLTFGDGRNGTTKYPEAPNYGGEFNGNKHSISGITVTMKGAMSTPTDTGFGLFGILRSGAYIHDLEIVDAQFTLSETFASRTYFAGLLAGKAEEGVKIEKVQISGKLTIGDIYSDQRFEYGKLLGRNEGAEIIETPDTNIELDYTPKSSEEEE